MKHLGYARLSRNDENDQSMSTKTQVKDLKSYQPEIEIFVDDGVSGENNMNDGEGWKRLYTRFLELAERGEEVQVSVAVFDRLGRRKGMVLYAIEEITRRNGSIHIVRDNKTITDPTESSQAIELLFNSFSSEQYRVETKKKTTRALKALKDGGVKLGNEPKLTRTDIARIHALQDKGLGYASIGKVMNVSAPTVKKVLNQSYMSKEDWLAHNAKARSRLHGGL